MTLRSPKTRRLKRLIDEAISNTSRGEAENRETGGGPEATRAPPNTSGAAHPIHSGSMERSRAV